MSDTVFMETNRKIVFTEKIFDMEKTEAVSNN